MFTQTQACMLSIYKKNQEREQGRQTDSERREVGTLCIFYVCALRVIILHWGMTDSLMSTADLPSDM